MAFIHDAIEAGGVTPPAAVKVWDPFVRVFHWTLLTLFVIAFVTGDEIEGVHIAAGYGIAALLAMRLAWGVHDDVEAWQDRNREHRLTRHHAA